MSRARPPDERDAWLREALRHAPDSDAAPPTDAQRRDPAPRRARPRRGRRRPGATARIGRAANPLPALWRWLARPPVAAGFASVMAATLVGLMWWDRPMDETLAASAALASEATRQRGAVADRRRPPRRRRERSPPPPARCRARAPARARATPRTALDGASREHAAAR